MWIESLNINNCRNLKDISINLSPGINIFFGENASGKTSLLESISILSKGRSFRSSHISDVITHGYKSVLVSAKISDNSSDYHIGIERSPRKTHIRINQQDIYTQAELSLHIPVTIIHPDSINIITGSPSIRRSYIDWLAFYLFPDFHLQWKNYRHILKQRNLCLRDAKHRYALDKWTNELIKSQPKINSYRKQIIDLIVPIFKDVSSDLLSDIDVDIYYKNGFPEDVIMDVEELSRFYNIKTDSDIVLKRTAFGVHRADMKILINNKLAIDNASRGQLKLLAISLSLSQSILIANKINKKGVLLVDDLRAELDKTNSDRLVGYIKQMQLQTIITTTTNDSYLAEQKMFHVKHGEITEHTNNQG